MATATQRPIVKAQPKIWQIDCSAPDCEGFVGTDGEWRIQWFEEDFNSKGRGRGVCDTCGRLYITQR
jgi:hypothetical protein